MAGPRRHSRTPQVLTREQQETYVQTAQANPRIREQLERILGKSTTTMSFQEIVRGVHDIQERGYVEGSLAGAINGSMDLARALDRRDLGIETHDRLIMLEQQNADLREENTQLRQRLDSSSTTKKAATKKAATAPTPAKEAS